MDGALTEPQPRKKPRKKFFRSHCLDGRARAAGVVKPGSSAAGSGTSMKKAVRKKFTQGFKGGDIERPITRARLKKPPKQLSYVLKFSTYHRPYEQQVSAKSPAKPLNPKEHAALLKWMSKFEFQDFLVLVNARRKGGTRVVLSPPADKKT